MKNEAKKRSIVRNVGAILAIASAAAACVIAFAYCLGDLSKTETLLACAALVSLAFANWLLSIAD